MEIKPLSERALLNEALCGSGELLVKSKLTNQEQMRLSAAEIKVKWLKKMMPEGLAAQIAYDGGTQIGFIEYMPIELSSFYKGKDLYILNCLDAPHTPPWAKTKSRRMPGCGSALVNAMIDDIKNKCNGIVGAYAIAYTSNLQKFFAKFGFEEFESKGIKKLIKKFAPFEFPERVEYENKYRFQPVPGKVVVDAFWRSFCPSGPLSLLNLREVCKEFGERVVLNEFSVDDTKELEKNGVEGVTYFDGSTAKYSYELHEKENVREILRNCLEECPEC